MRLYVYVLEGKDLAAKDSYVKLQIGKHKSKTRVLRDTTNPAWNEEFAFRVHAMDDELVVSVYHHDDDSGFFNASGDLMGRVRIPVWSVVAEENHKLPPRGFYFYRKAQGFKIDQQRWWLVAPTSLFGSVNDGPSFLVD
ncbi:C2 and GRAM domain-containing protein [Camellia lanceoleosa]|uniref:C2 and GRAM domain-containing protein n=1 Tax=Camellia lanceoleosa TaxID=1840588 RepID=A0ACC0FAK4_9ERIC|nr:C2 and GRAM domain-containing protein [Camellia lanceoleosa]